MKIMAPCKLGEAFLFDGMQYHLTNISWNQWHGRMEFAYMVKERNLILLDKHFAELFPVYEIEDSKLIEQQIIKHGFPLTGIGYITGIGLKNEEIFADFIITSRYNGHIKVACDETVTYQGGKVFFPPIPSFETQEKRAKAVTKEYREKYHLV